MTEIPFSPLTLPCFSNTINPVNNYGDEENSTQGAIPERNPGGRNLRCGGRILCVSCGTGLGALHN